MLTIGPAGTRNIRPSGIDSTASRVWLNGAKLTAINATFGGLTWSLAQIVGKPVVDETGDKSRYDFEPEIGGADASAVPELLASRLGLSLTRATREFEYLVVK